MAMTDKLKQILNGQESLISEFNKEISNLDSEDLVAENDKYKNELQKIKKELDQELSNNKKLTDENKILKNSLYEQLYNEKIAMLKMINKKIDAYYQSNVGNALNELVEYEFNSKRHINQMVETLQRNKVDSSDEIYGKIAELNKLLEVKITNVRQELANQRGAFSDNKDKEFNRLHDENINETEIKSALKKNNIESLIGLNILNKVGIFFLLIGVIAGVQFIYFQLSDILKSISAFGIGILLLLFGEFLNRKQKSNVFSQGMTSGGVAILYAALALSFFGLKIIENSYVALILCIAITALAFLLSKRYNSETIAAFALVGGFLPIFIIASTSSFIYSVMIYFIILNLLGLIVSLNKKWTVLSYIGYFLNLAATIYIFVEISLKISRGEEISKVIFLLYLIFTFIIYTLLPIASNFIKKLQFNKYDIILLGINTAVSSILMYIQFTVLEWTDNNGLLAIIFAAVYLSLGKFIELRLPKEDKIQALFYLTGFTFVVLIIPFQFGILWLSLGWLIEGVVIAVYGILKDYKNFKKGGFIISGLCLGAFLIFDIVPYIFNQNDMFAYKYFAMTLGSIIIMAAFMYKKNLGDSKFLIFKYCATSNLWLFLLYILGITLFKELSLIFKGSNMDIEYLIAALCICISFLYAYIIPRIRILADNNMKAIAVFINFFSALWLFILNCTASLISIEFVPVKIFVLATIILIFINLLAILSMRDAVKCLVIEKKLTIEWFPLIVSGYFVVMLTVNLISQYQMHFTNFIISIIYLIASLSWIIFGFVRRYALIRRFGLGLSILAITKLFIIDIALLTDGYRIITYFAFGIILIAISFVYQYFCKRLEVNDETIADIRKKE